MSAREALALSQGYWAGPSTSAQNRQAAQTLWGMQSQPARWRKSRRGGGVGHGNRGKTNTRNNYSKRNMRKNRRNTRRNRRN